MQLSDVSWAWIEYNRLYLDSYKHPTDPIILIQAMEAYAKYRDVNAKYWDEVTSRDL